MKENFTAIAAVLDRSGSMRSIVSETIAGFNTFVERQKEADGDAILTLAIFDDNYELIHDAIPLNDVPELTSATYFARGWTALMDAVGRTINVMGARLSAMPEDERPSKVLVLIMTDGAENYSKEFDSDKIKEMISHQREVYSWEFVFIGANQDAILAGASLGVAAAQSYGYTASAVGTRRLFDNVTKGTLEYRNSAVRSSYIMTEPTKANGD